MCTGIVKFVSESRRIMYNDNPKCLVTLNSPLACQTTSLAVSACHSSLCSFNKPSKRNYKLDQVQHSRRTLRDRILGSVALWSSGNVIDLCLKQLSILEHWVGYCQLSYGLSRQVQIGQDYFIPRRLPWLIIERFPRRHHVRGIKSEEREADTRVPSCGKAKNVRNFI